MGCNRSRSDGGGGGGGGTRRGGGQKWPALVQHAWRNAHRLSENERGKGMGGRISYCGQGDGDSRWLGRRWRQRLKAAAAAAVKSWDANHTKSMKRNKRGKRERVSGRGGNGPAIKDNSRQERQQTTVVTAYGGGSGRAAPTSCQPRWGYPWSCLSVAFDCVSMKRYRMYRLPTVLAAVIVLSPQYLSSGKCRSADS